MREKDVRRKGFYKTLSEMPYNLVLKGGRSTSETHSATKDQGVAVCVREAVPEWVGGGGGQDAGGTWEENGERSK